MWTWFWQSQSEHRRLCEQKRQSRSHQIHLLSSYLSSLPQPLALTPERETEILSHPASELVKKCQSGELDTKEVMRVYTKKVIEAQEKTNCVVEFLVGVGDLGGEGESDFVEEEEEPEEKKRTKRQHLPLLGLPITIKDTIDISNHPPPTLGFSSSLSLPPLPPSSSAPIINLLRDAGALLIARTTVPTGLFSISTRSHIFGPTTNPYKPHTHGVGASTGGGSALVSFLSSSSSCTPSNPSGGTALIDLGSDIASSLRLPSHCCGTYSLKGSVGRFPSLGNRSPVGEGGALPDGLKIVGGVQSGRLEELELVWRVVLGGDGEDGGMKGWEYDYTCLPIPWRHLSLHAEKRKLKWGVIWEDGIIPPTPACRRALQTVIDALKADGHDVVDFTPPPLVDLLAIGYQLIFADGGKQLQTNLLPGDSLTPPLSATLSLLSLPLFLKRLLAFYHRHISPTPDPLYASLLEVMHPKTVFEERRLLQEKEVIKGKWEERWKEERLDFVLSVPFPFPAVRCEGDGEEEVKVGLLSAGYGFFVNLLDYVGATLPVTNVDASIDTLPPSHNLSNNNIAKLAYSVYDPKSMHGLPLGVQIVGRRLEEEKVMEGMKMVEEALRGSGVKFDRAKV